MAVSSTLTLPGQPAAGGGTEFCPLGGDGKTAPLGIYDVDMQIVGDVSGGNATVTLAFDPRYTSLIQYVQPFVSADAAKGDFQIVLFDLGTLPQIRVGGTMAGVAESMTTKNSTWTWYPPPVWCTGTGRIQCDFPNVDATETYGMTVSMYVFDRNVVQITPLQILNWVALNANTPNP